MASSIHAPSGPTRPPATPPEPAAPTADGVLEAAWASRRAVVGLPLALALAGVLAAMIVTPTYSATTSFVTQSRERSQGAGAFQSLATQLGMVAGAGATSSPQFYADVLRSREVMAAVLRSPVPDPRTPAPNDSAPVLDLLPVGAGSPAERMERGIVEMRRRATVSVNTRTGIIELLVGMQHPTAAADAARRFVEVLNRFNLGTWQTQARARREFAQGRLRESDDSLRLAEAALERFLTENREFRDAPTLRFRQERLERRVLAYQDLASSFRREYELARVDEVNDTPLLTVIDSASVPLRPSSPRRSLFALVGAMLGVLVASVIVAARAYEADLRATAPERHARLVAMRSALWRTRRPRRPPASLA